MNITLSQKKFLDSEEARLAREELRRMESDASYNTQPIYVTGLIQALPFVEKHMTYLSNRPKLDPQQYLANLRLMTRIKA
jgi:hypothetical protein